MDNTIEYNVTCAGCRHRFNAMTADWCACPAGKLSLACPGCSRCLCRAPEALRSAFWQTAPAALIERRSDEQNRRLGVNPPAVSSLAPRVLVVDDDEELRGLITDFVSRCGYRTVSAVNASEALSFLPSWQPNIVITDALMPRMDGRELCRRIKGEDPWIKVVVVTSLYTGLRYRNEAMRDFMADEYLSKPIDFARLHEILTTFAPLNGKPGRPASRRQATV